MDCPICATTVNEKDYKKTFISHYNNQEYKLYHCSACSLEFWSPLKVVPEFYDSEIFQGYILFHEGLRKLPHWQRPFFKFFPFNTGKLLDIGCGDGVFLKQAQKLGFEVYGIDFDKKSIEAAKNKFNLENVYAMSLEEFVSFAEQKKINFDIITFFEVLEHQDDPKNFIINVKKLLKERGYIYGSVPNKDRLWVNMDRRGNNGDFPPHHFLWFSKRVLEFFFKQEGFNNVKFYPEEFSLMELAALIEITIFGRYTNRIKNRLKKMIVTNERHVYFSLEEIEKNQRTNGLSLKALKLVQSFRNVFFVPVAFFVLPFWKKRGICISFQAQVKDIIC